MEGWQIASFLQMDSKTRKCYKGIALRDEIPLQYRSDKPALYILNTDRSDGPGQHWCVVYYYRNTAEFFDPFGMHPTTYGLDIIVESRGFQYLVHNTCTVQNILSSVCGYHCLFYAFHRVRGCTLMDILNTYYCEDAVKNDKMVSKFTSGFGSMYTMK